MIICKHPQTPAPPGNPYASKERESHHPRIQGSICKTRGFHGQTTPTIETDLEPPTAEQARA
ncbi:hypothetical protein Bca101_043585 [Brassica carinata]